MALRTEEQKVRYWKSFEKQRFNWYKKVELETKKLLLQEAQAIGGVYRSSGDKGVSNYLSGRKKIWEKVLKSTANGIVVEFSKQSYESVIPPGKSVEKFGKKEFDPYDPFMFDYVESYGASRATLITETSKDRANQILRVGLVEGQTVDDQAKNLQEVYTQDAEYRSMRMARTEVVSASNFGSLAGMEQTGFKMTKMWVSSRDDRVRETHDMVDGEEVPLDEPFSNDMMYPGDINGSAEEVIMCRCTMAYDVPMQEAPTGESLGNDTFNMNHEDFVNYWMENKVINSAEPGYFSSMSENYYGGDKGLKKLWQEKGFDAPPKIVNEKELSAFIKEQNRPEFYRGIAGDSAKKYTEAFKSGDYYPGLGMHGNGTYAAANGEEAHRIATVYGRIAEMEGGQVMRFSIDKSANIISDSKLWDWQKELDDVLRKKLADPNLDSITEAKLLSVRDAIGNNGRLATMKNVDAYYLSSGVDREGNYWIIQNRSKLIVQDTNVERYIPIE